MDNCPIIDFLLFFKLTGLGKDHFFNSFFGPDKTFSNKDYKQSLHFNTRIDDELCNSLGHDLILDICVTLFHFNLALSPYKY